MSENRVSLHWFRHESDDLEVNSYLALLDAQELAAFENFENQAAASDFARRRSLRRRVLAEKLGLLPQQLRFQTNSAGKPRLVDDQGTYHFNASHGRHGGVVATSEKLPIGIDIEFIRPIDAAAFAKKILSPKERVQHQAHDDLARLEYLFSIWTAKEAVIKALGAGLNLNLLPQITVEPEKAQTSWRTATLSSPFPNGHLNVWTQRLDDVFSTPAIVSIAAQQKFKVELFEAD